MWIIQLAVIIAQRGRVYCNQSQSVRYRRRSGETNWLWNIGKGFTDYNEELLEEYKYQNKGTVNENHNAFSVNEKLFQLQGKWDLCIYVLLNLLLYKTEKQTGTILKAWGKKNLTILN